MVSQQPRERGPDHRWLQVPWAAIKTLSQPNYQWTVNFLTTLYAVLGAFALSAALSVVIAV